jgi:hypothetical protein
MDFFVSLKRDPGQSLYATEQSFKPLIYNIISVNNISIGKCTEMFWSVNLFPAFGFRVCRN